MLNQAKMTTARPVAANDGFGCVGQAAQIVDAAEQRLNAPAVRTTRLADINGRIASMQSKAYDLVSSAANSADRMLGAEPEVAGNKQEGRAPAIGELDEIVMSLDHLDQLLNQALYHADRISSV